MVRLAGGRRVVVTGLGCVTPLGTQAATTRSAELAGTAVDGDRTGVAIGQPLRGPNRSRVSAAISRSFGSRGTNASFVPAVED